MTTIPKLSGEETLTRKQYFDGRKSPETNQLPHLVTPIAENVFLDIPLTFESIIETADNDPGVLPSLVDAILQKNPDWADDANCKGTPAERMHPTDGPGTRKVISAFCVSCSVRVECLAEDIKDSNPSGLLGVKGGVSINNRKKLVKIVNANRPSAAEE